VDSSSEVSSGASGSLAWKLAQGLRSYAGCLVLTSWPLPLASWL
jgi:hypothetical protein